jgi:hypothetical protein
MDCINIDELTAYSNDEIYALTKWALSDKGKEKLGSAKIFYFMAYLTRYVSDEKLLDETIDLFIIGKFLESKLNDEKIKAFITGEVYSDLHLVKLKSVIYSVHIEYNLLLRFGCGLKDIQIPELICSIDGKTVKHNLSEIGNFVQHHSIKSVVNRFKDEEDFIEMINGMIDIDYTNQTNTFDEDIKYLKNKKEVVRKPQRPETFDSPSIETYEKTPFKFENNFDHVPPKKVYDYFKKELVDTNYLSLKDLQLYLTLAFQEKKVPDERFKIQGKYTIAVVRSIFVKYYNELAQDKHNLKKEYCELLGEYFNGFSTKKLINNFR